MPNLPQPKIGQNLDGAFKPVFPTPNITDRQLLAYLETKIEDYLAVVYGTPPPENTNPDQMLVQQVQVDWNLVQRLYAKDRTLEQTYNASISYQEEAVSYPTWSRDFIVRRYNYIPQAKGSVITGLVTATVTAGGTGYDQATVAVTFAGGTGTGGAISAVVSNGAVTNLVITAVGTYTVAPTITITGGTGATGTVAIQPQTAYLVKEDMIRTPDSPLDSLYVLVRKIYMVMPGPSIVGQERSQAVRGQNVVTTEIVGLTGSVDPTVGSLIISSQSVPIDTVRQRRVTKEVAQLPADELWAYWDFVALPTLLFDIVNTIYCNDSQFATVVTNPVLGGGSSVLRKHRKTVSYSSTVPNLTPDLSASSFTVANIEYRGKVIQFSYNNVLNDSISYSEDFAYSSGMSACVWTEAYDFSPTTPTATDFLAGAWYVKSYIPEQFGESMWKITLIEFFSAEGNPNII